MTADAVAPQGRPAEPPGEAAQGGAHRAFHDLLRGHAAAAPDAPAVLEDGRTLSFAGLVQAVERRAAQYRAAGLAPGDRVALVAENSGDHLVTAFAVWLAGGVVASVYPSSGADDLAWCLERSDPVLVVTDPATLPAIRAARHPDLPVGLVDGSPAEPSASGEPLRRDRMPSPAGLPGTLALICFTSGTTSRPKAIMLSAEGLLNAVRTHVEVWRLTAADRAVVALPMAWLYGLATASMSALGAGGAVVPLRRARPELLLDALVRHRVTWLPGVTTMYVKLAEHLAALRDRRAAAGEPAPDLSSLRFCVSGGEPRNEAAFARWRALGGRPVHDTYCATECFPMVSYDPVADPEPVPGSAGKVVPRSAIRVVGDDGAELPAGEVGEGLWHGPGLMLGYWRDEELTAAAFTADGWYRSRDLVRVDADGYVHVVGRLSDLILRGGSNVSPAEVERVLAELPGVRDVAVVGLPDPTYGQQVVAALALLPGAEFDEVRAREFAAARLAGYKVPERFVLLEALPQNATSGKLDRRRILELLSAGWTG